MAKRGMWVLCVNPPCFRATNVTSCFVAWPNAAGRIRRRSREAEKLLEWLTENGSLLELNAGEFKNLPEEYQLWSEDVSNNFVRVLREH